MTDGVLRKYAPQECARMRNDLLRNHFAPNLERVFEAYPALQSAVLLVAQYFNDEADDAVHARIAYSMQRDPDVQAFLEAMRTWSVGLWPFMEEEETVRALRHVAGRRAVSVASERAERARLNELLFGWIWGDDRRVAWDQNGEVIALFAAFCSEGAHEGGYLDQYSPYAVFRRAGSDRQGKERHALDIEVVGKKVRPWLEGVYPQWELRKRTDERADRRIAAIVERLQQAALAHGDFRQRLAVRLQPGDWAAVYLNEAPLLMIYCRERLTDLVTNPIATRVGAGSFSETTVETPHANTAALALEQLEFAFEMLHRHRDEFAALGWEV